MLHLAPAAPDGLEAIASGLGWRALNRPGPVVAGVIGAALEEEATVIALCRVGGADAVAGIPLGRVAEGVALAAPCPVLLAYPRAALTLAVRELDSAEFPLADEVWRDYHETRGDPAVDRVFALFADRTSARSPGAGATRTAARSTRSSRPSRSVGRGYARRVMAGLVEACHNEDLFMYAVAGLEPFYARFGFVEIPQTDPPADDPRAGTTGLRATWRRPGSRPCAGPPAGTGGTTDTPSPTRDLIRSRAQRLRRWPTSATSSPIPSRRARRAGGVRLSLAAATSSRSPSVTSRRRPCPGCSGRPRYDEDGRDRPRWHDRAWTAAFVARAAGPADRAPVVVVIEPGDEWSRPGGPRPGDRRHPRGIPRPLRQGSAGPGRQPGRAVPSRRQQRSRSSGSTSTAMLPTSHPIAGIALDAPEFYAATRTRMTAELALVPPGALRYVRLHTRGRKARPRRAPSLAGRLRPGPAGARDGPARAGCRGSGRARAGHPLLHGLAPGPGLHLSRPRRLFPGLRLRVLASAAIAS